MNTKTVINIKIDKKLKVDAKRVAGELGLPLGTIVNTYLRNLVREKRVVFSAPPVPNKKTAELLKRTLRDVKQGKNVDGPFTSTKDVLAYLHN
jgi:addiction module RelB/DinJ family antitoxin